MSSGPHTAKIEELRRQRGLIDQTIAALEILNGDRPMPAAPAETYTAMPDPPARAAAAPRKLLPATTGKAGRRQQRSKVLAPRDARARLTLRPNSEADDQAVLAAVRKLGSATRTAVVQTTKLSEQRVTLAKNRLQTRGQLVVTGWAHAARWSLPDSAKEAP